MSRALVNDLQDQIRRGAFDAPYHDRQVQRAAMAFRYPLGSGSVHSSHTISLSAWTITSGHEPGVRMGL